MLSSRSQLEVCPVLSRGFAHHKVIRLNDEINSQAKCILNNLSLCVTSILLSVNFPVCVYVCIYSMWCV